MTYLSKISAVVLGLAALCAVGDEKPAAKTESFARAFMVSKNDSTVSGTVEFALDDEGLFNRVQLDHVPAGSHAFRIHEGADCKGTDAKGSGKDYNPTGESHGSPKTPHHHVGDLGNLVADSAEKVRVEQIIPNPASGRFTGWEKILGKTVVIYSTTDDFNTQAEGASGKIIGCGVIQPYSSPKAE